MMTATATDPTTDSTSITRLSQESLDQSDRKRVTAASVPSVDCFPAL